MGGRPITALNLAAFPATLDLGVLRQILEGGGSKIEEAGAALCGGHSLQDDEPKYGVSATGWVESERVVRNGGARPGDALVLTKPLGFGILATALKREIVEEPEIEDAVEVAARLNRGACEALQAVGVSAATDVTGFGLLGHLSEMMLASDAGAVLRRGAIPVWERAESLAADCYPAGLEANREYLAGSVSADGVSDDALQLLYDPQTSGGLLIAVAGERVDALVSELEQRGDGAAVVGEVVAGAGLTVTP